MNQETNHSKNSNGARKILITGGAGFIGYHLAKRLVERDNQVVIADLNSPASTDKEFKALLTLPNVKMIKADLTQQSAWNKVGNDYDYVYHLMSISRTKLFHEIPHEVLRVGIMGTINVLTWFHLKNKKVGAKILLASSNEVYIGSLESFGALPIPTSENTPLVIPDPCNPRWSYAGQKLMGELFFIHYSKAYNFRMSIVRMHNVYGPRAGHQPMIPKIIAQAKKRADPFQIFGPDDKRTFCFVEDAVRALQMVIESPKTDGETYNIASNHTTSVRDITEIIFSSIKWRPKNITTKQSPEGGVKSNVPDVSKIKRDVDWEAKINMQEGLEKTVVWYSSRL